MSTLHKQVCHWNKPGFDDPSCRICHPAPTPAPIRVESDGSRIYGRRMVRNTRGRYTLARLELLPNGKWRADYVGSGLVELFDVEPEHVAV